MKCMNFNLQYISIAPHHEQCMNFNLQYISIAPHHEVYELQSTVH